MYPAQSPDTRHSKHQQKLEPPLASGKEQTNCVRLIALVHLTGTLSVELRQNDLKKYISICFTNDVNLYFMTLVHDQIYIKKHLGEKNRS